MNRTQLITYLDDYLQINAINDYGPQGLQVEATADDVQRIAVAVDCALPVIEAAAAWGADLLLVHHGILWRSVERIAGPLGARVRRLLAANIHLYAAHLALDAHPVVGNNAQLADLVGLPPDDRTGWYAPTGTPIGIIGTLAQPLDRDELAARLATRLNAAPRLLAHGPQLAQHVAIMSGGGADLVGMARDLGADTYITGETSHAHYWSAADYGINTLFAGHYASETVGVQALAQHLATQFGLTWRFFDFPTGM